MAEEAKKGEEGVGKAAAAPAVAAAKSKLPLIIGLVVGLLVIGGGVAGFLLTQKKADPTEAELQAAAAESAGPVEEGHDDEDELDEGEEALGAFLPLETFVVNLQGGSFVRVQIQLEFVERDVPKRFYTRVVPIRDGIVLLLSGKTAAGLLTERGKGELKNELKELVNGLLRRDLVKRVYFTQFVIQ